MATSNKPTRNSKPAEPTPGSTAATSEPPAAKQTSARNARRTTSAATTAVEPEPTPEVIKPTGNQCLCGCGGPVKGKYRPGHDARYVSQQATAFVAAAVEEKPAILDRLERELSPALMAKWAARVERLSAKDQKVYEAGAAKANTKKEN